MTNRTLEKERWIHRLSALGGITRSGASRIKSMARRAMRRARGLRDLSGDRNMEWMYLATRMGQYNHNEARVLDFGCGSGILSIAAANMGQEVLAIDLTPQSFSGPYPNIEFRQTDIMALDERKEQFSLILSCSTIEHVGLSGRYSSIEFTDGDLKAMDKLGKLLRPQGHIIMTLPVGQDAVFSPYHRVYGRDRLPRLLEGYEIVESQFSRKDRRNIWLPCSREEALCDIADAHYYALAFLVLCNPS
ncbi:MAG TPA: class I SAM-dependent methyltransferase [Phycisphaerae bacterium]|nr:class I SAM-dependent methyltransferase [Phycisphaerae bacterium]